MQLLRSQLLSFLNRFVAESVEPSRNGEAKVGDELPAYLVAQGVETPEIPQVSVPQTLQ